ncbi:hypothetical protein ABEF92_001880 [Exophiala dermatitidis]|uniref:Uncharacterized protein n=1 Tax=Exophiala dermatitidis (strain ATCC 34100 / CBS 525.76 / NIH/UT8656) TaxID=858893 RepID=H6C527_EXODN|nr:uncharacterized protein HMPREF1120_06930 [Exophiala dermatitidis NIH/UT8656]EHY58928.1 hypothetical protein HMPREF1120_06930 [Exophiala dermatitidis NIH/UT8656]
MTAARLSPAASLLRNSKLFALPPPVSLPPTEPSSEPIAFSDTATTPYPLRAALETPKSSLQRGDWGLKRSLPVETTTKTGTPTVRIQGGIDTREHIADFESAADHVMTLRKFQELNLRLTLPAAKDKRSSSRTSVFHHEVDHTAAQPAPALDKKYAPSSWLHMSESERIAQLPKHLRDKLQEIAKAKPAPSQSEATPPSQPASSIPASSHFAQETRRWRYSGPYLAGLNGMEFENFLKKINREKRAEFREYVRKHLNRQRAEEQRAAALEEGRTATTDVAEATEEDVTAYLRHLRSEPGKFGPLIAEFFDLADGPRPPSQTTDPWSYGRDTISADPYRESGPPRTHPSAGLSYMSSEMFSQNDIMVGPRDTRPPVPARLLKSIPTTHNRNVPFVGVAGFVVPQPTHTSLTDYNWKWEPVKDGPKMVVAPTAATVSQVGKAEIQTRLLPTWHLEDDVPVNSAERRPKDDHIGTNRRTSGQLPRVDRNAARRRYSSSRPAPEPSQDISEEIDAMIRAASSNPLKKKI